MILKISQLITLFEGPTIGQYLVFILPEDCYVVALAIHFLESQQYQVALCISTGLEHWTCYAALLSLSPRDYSTNQGLGSGPYQDFKM